MSENSLPWIVFQVNKAFYSLPSQNVIAIIKELKITKLPQMPLYVKGIVRYREELFKIFDMRSIIGAGTKGAEIAEFNAIMDQRQQDHINWIQALENSVENNTSFTLATDPHKCAFGKWYDSFLTEDLKLKTILDKFSTPHDKIHAIAKVVGTHLERGEYNEAKEIINRTRTFELKQMLNLFPMVKEAYQKSNNGYLILLKIGDSKYGIAVDNVSSVESVEEVDSDSIENGLLERSGSVIKFSLGKLHSGEFVLRLSDSDLLNN